MEVTNVNKFEVRIHKPTSNLMEVVATVESDEVEDAISVLTNRWRSSDNSLFFGQVWEVDTTDGGVIHYEIKS